MRVTINVLLIKHCLIQLCNRFQLSIADHRLERNSEACKWVYNAHINSHFFLIPMRIDRKLSIRIQCRQRIFDRLYNTLGLPLNFLYIIFFNICKKKKKSALQIHMLHVGMHIFQVWSPLFFLRKSIANSKLCWNWQGLKSTRPVYRLVET